MAAYLKRGLITNGSRKLDNAMTVEDLIAELQNFPPEAKVFFTCDYGDIGHTRQALPVDAVNEMDEDEYLTESAYSQSRMAFDTNEPGEDDCDEDGDIYHDGDRPEIVILSS